MTSDENESLFSFPFMISLSNSVISISLKIWLKTTLQIWRTSETQDHDEKLVQSTVKYSERYSHKTINDVENIFGHTKPGDNPANWKIALPEDLIKPTIKWYHQVTGYPEARGFMDNYDKDTIIEIYVEWLTTLIATFARELNQMARNMDSYQSMKSNQSCLKNVLWTYQDHGIFKAIDVPIQDPKPRFQTKNTSHNCCLFFVCLFASFTNSRMESDSQKCHIRDVCTTAKNSQNMASTKEYINEALSIAMHAMKAAINSTLGSSPGSLTFNRDMLLNIPLIADWHKDEHI